MSAPAPSRAEPSLDPTDWDAVRATFRAAVDVALDHVEHIREKSVWTPTPAPVKATLREAAPRRPQALDGLLTRFVRDFLPHATGNLHPRFFGWVHGGGNIAGALGEMLAAFINSNLGGRDHVGVYVERQVIDWCKEILGFPATSSGLLTSGTSMATVIALAAARSAQAGADVRQLGMAGLPKRLVGYASSEAHVSVAKAFELLGFGREALRSVAVDEDFRLSVSDLARQIAQDRADGLEPSIVVASAGTVNTGAIDDLAAIAAFCREQRLWLHVDAAFGGFAALLPAFRAPLAGMAEADSIAFDFHKWLQVPYDAGGVLVKDEAAHRGAFSSRRDYLAPAQRGLAGGEPWFCEYGPELSRGFRALKVWFTLKAHGLDRLAQVIRRNCEQARMLGRMVAASRDLELLVPVSLNIVCFRVVAPGLADAALDHVNEDIVAELQLRGIAVPSTTRLGGKTAIRVALTNHRTTSADIDILVDAVRRIASERLPAGDAAPRVVAMRR
jgi:aromatic-L-amino-acid/L-tryptophan decarboxylase